MAFAAGAALGAASTVVLWSIHDEAEIPAIGAAIAPETTQPAAPIILTTPASPGLKNFHRVSEGLYRGAQPTAEGIRQLKAMGFKTIINLRNLHTNHDKLGDTGIAYEHIYVNPLSLDTDEVVRFLQIVSDPSRQPVFVHCLRGSDRTGMMVAAYRVACQGWTVDEAVTEWTDGPFGFYKSLQYMVDFFRTIDFDAVRRRSGLDAPPPR